MSEGKGEDGGKTRPLRPLADRQGMKEKTGGWAGGGRVKEVIMG